MAVADASGFAVDGSTRLSAMEAAPLVRIVDASLGVDAQVSLVVSRVSHPDRLKSAWSSSGATLERIGDHAKNVAEHVIYLVEGADVRHASLDEMAEAVRNPKSR